MGTKPQPIEAYPARERTMAQQYADLHKAVTRLYFAAHWLPDRDCDAAEIWTAVRDAAGFAPGYSTEVLGPCRGVMCSTVGKAV